MGAFARSLLLRNECDVELVLMTTAKPDSNLFMLLSNHLPAKFEVCVCLCVCCMYVCLCACVVSLLVVYCVVCLCGAMSVCVWC